MAGYIHEFFGYRALDDSNIAQNITQDLVCPFIRSRCVKTLSDGTVSGACAIGRKSAEPVICCPIRLYSGNYQILREISRLSFGNGHALYAGKAAKTAALELGEPTVAIFGKGWHRELRLPKRKGIGNYFVDWVLALLNPRGELEEFVAAEVQTIDTTGNYRKSRESLLNERKIEYSTVGLNWENVNKRILPQLIYKGQILQREEFCRKGLFFISPEPVFARIVERLGGMEKLTDYALQPAAITFLSYDYSSLSTPYGYPQELSLKSVYTTTVFKVQEAFNNVALPERDVFKRTILEALSG